MVQDHLSHSNVSHSSVNVRYSNVSLQLSSIYAHVLKVHLPPGGITTTHMSMRGGDRNSGVKSVCMQVVSPLEAARTAPIPVELTDPKLVYFITSIRRLYYCASWYSNNTRRQSLPWIDYFICCIIVC